MLALLVIRAYYGMYTVKTNMPSNETYRSQFESPSQRWKAVPKAVRNLYRDEDLFQYYQAFKQKYAGDPYYAEHPELVRERGGHRVSYDVPVLAAITTSGQHFIYIAAGHDDNGSLDPQLQFFVVTADCITRQETEWWVTDVRANAIGQPSRLELHLSAQPVHEIPDYVEPYNNDSPHPFADLDRIDDATQAQLEADAQAIKYVYEHQASYLSWGDGKAHSIFRSLSEVEADLYLLHQAERAGLLGDAPVGHRAVIEHIERAA